MQTFSNWARHTRKQVMKSSKLTLKETRTVTDSLGGQTSGLLVLNPHGDTNFNRANTGVRRILEQRPSMQ